VQRWEYQVVYLKDRKYTAALNEYGRNGWELVSVVAEAVAPAPPEKARGFPLPRAIGRLEEAANKIGGAEAPEPSAASGERLLWVFRRPLSED
jgi:hypothetical protein